MAIRVPSDQLINPQSLQAVVAGPDGANRLFTYTGQVPVGYGSSQNALTRQTYTWLLGPQLQRRQFIAATAHVSIAYYGSQGQSSQTIVQLDLAEADWDDESQQVECRAELSTQCASPTATATVFVWRLSYQVTVLAEIAP